MSRRGAVTGVERALPGGGWPWLAASMMFTAGAYNAMWGSAAIAGESYFTPDELLLGDLDPQVWGALTLAWGIALLGCAALVYARRAIGTRIGTVFAVIAIAGHVLAISTAPGWSIAGIAITLLLLYALRRARRAIERGDAAR
jgi:hypothetical protein